MELLLPHTGRAFLHCVMEAAPPRTRSKLLASSHRAGRSTLVAIAIPAHKGGLSLDCSSSPVVGEKCITLRCRGISNHMRDWQLRYHHSKKEKYEGSAQRLGKIGKSHLKYEKSNIFKHKH